MKSAPTEWQHPQLRGFRAELSASPAICERILAALAEPCSPPKRAVVRSDTASIGPALRRAFALAVAGVSPRVELIDA